MKQVFESGKGASCTQLALAVAGSGAQLRLEPQGSFRMFDHLSLGVRDLDAARAFYDAFFAPLGAAVSSASAKELAYGPGGQGGLFYLYPVDGAQVAGLGAHLAFTADSRLAVDEAYRQAMAHGATAIRVAGPHPDIAPGYYGCVILDPDGNKLEIVAGAMH